MERAAIVTGASSGIGLAIARALAEDGYGVALAARRAALLEEAAAEIGPRALPVPTDVADARSADALVRAVAERFGRVDVVVASAGVGHWASLERTDEAAWDETIDVNLKGTYLVARAALPHLRESGGYLIALSSVSGTIGQAGGTAYNASKWGVRGFVQSFLKETRDDGVRATSICPGLVATPMTDREEADDVISVEDVVLTVRWLLALRPIVQVRDVVLERTLA
ncbi:MAG TPA: SDR family NAD(P)-dependent oxidoreductase [Gaiellaceae bacterium]|nr:SDR family NAD(P)-dependent oxidoreductase [Gaiellaceae bacterium]